MKKFVVDTVALIKYFEDTLPKSADKVFKEAEKGETRLLLPSIVIGEYIYSYFKSKPKTDENLYTIAEIISGLFRKDFFEFIDMQMSDWINLLDINIPELHDRMICAVALSRNADGIVTSDAVIVKSGLFKTVW